MARDTTVRVRIVGLDGTGNAWRSANSRVRGHQRRVGRLTRQYLRLTGAVRSLNSVVGAMPIAGAAGGVAVFGFLGKSIFEAGMKMDSLKNSMIVATKSMMGAEMEIRRIKRLSKELGVNFVATADAYKKFNIAAKEVGMTSKVSDRIFRSVAKASAAMGLSSENTRLTLKALEQMISKGNVQAEELRGQLGEHLPGAFGMAAQAMSKTTQELNKMLERGELLATDLLPRLADVLENKFSRVAVRAAKQPRAALERLKNAWFELLVAFNKSGAGRAIADMMKWLTKHIEKLAQNFDQYTLNFIQMLRDWNKALMVFVKSNSTIGDMFSGIFDSMYSVAEPFIDKIWNYFTQGAVVAGKSALDIMGGVFKGLSAQYHSYIVDVKDKNPLAFGKTEAEEAINHFESTLKTLADKQKRGIRTIRSLAGDDTPISEVIGEQSDLLEEAWQKYEEIVTPPTVDMTPLENAKKSLDGIGEALKKTVSIVEQTDLTPLVNQIVGVDDALAASAVAVQERMDAIKFEDLIERYLVAMQAFGRDELIPKVIAHMRTLREEGDMTFSEMGTHLGAMREAVTLYNNALSESPPAGDLGSKAFKNLLHTLKMLNPEYKKIYEHHAKIEEMQKMIVEAAEQWGFTTEQTALLNEALIESMKDGLDEVKTEWQEAAEAMKDSMASTITDAIMGFKSLKEMISDIGNMIARMIIQKSIADPIATGISGAIGKLDFGFGTSHSGGIIGKDTPKFHNGGIVGGLGSNEVPAILEKGEMVLTREQQKAVGNNVVNVTYSPQVNALDPRTAATVIAQNAPTVVGIIRQAMNRNGRAIAI